MNSEFFVNALDFETPEMKPNIDIKPNKLISLMFIFDNVYINVPQSDVFSLNIKYVAQENNKTASVEIGYIDNISDLLSYTDKSIGVYFTHEFITGRVLTISAKASISSYTLTDNSVKIDFSLGKITIQDVING